ncbi:hypothetical protein [Corynebacterium parakroppenstedtii]
MAADQWRVGSVRAACGQRAGGVWWRGCVAPAIVVGRRKPPSSIVGNR